MHHHHAGEGTVVEGTVIQHAPARGYVPHMSNGITFTDTVAYDVDGAAYWWDPSEKDTDSHSDGTLWARAACFRRQRQCVLPRRLVDPRIESHRGLRGGRDRPGRILDHDGRIQWGSKGDGVWATENIVSHNNRRGIYRWNNHNLLESSVDTTLYNNHASFIQGAYGANHLYDGLTLRSDSIIWKTGAGESENGSYPKAGIVDFDIDVMRLAEDFLHLSGAQVPGGEPTVFRDGTCAGYTGRHAVTGEIMQNRRVFDFVRVTNNQGEQLEPEDFDIVASNPDKGLDLTIRVQHEDGSAYQMTWRGTQPEPDISRIRAFDSR